MAKHETLLGIGLDVQFSHRYPSGIVALCDAYRDRVSHFSVVSLPSRPMAAKFRDTCTKDRPVVHHLPGIAPADPHGPKLDKLRRLNEVSDELNAMWICEDVAIWSIG